MNNVKEDNSGFIMRYTTNHFNKLKDKHVWIDGSKTEKGKIHKHWSKILRSERYKGDYKANHIGICTVNSKACLVVGVQSLHCGRSSTSRKIDVSAMQYIPLQQCLHLSAK